MSRLLVGGAGAVALIALQQMQAPTELLWFTVAAMLAGAALLQWWKTTLGAVAFVGLIAVWSGVVGYAMWWSKPAAVPSQSAIAAPAQAPAPSVDEIAEAVVKKLPVTKIQLEAPVASTPQPPVASARLLSLYSQYAYEWSNYRGARGTGVSRDEARDIDPEIPLRKPFGTGEHLLALGIANYNRVPMEASLVLVRPDNVSIEFGGCWQWVTGRTYRCVLGEGPKHQIDALTGLHADYQLKVKFPKPDSYKFEYTLKPTGLPDARVDVFTIVLEP